MLELDFYVVVVAFGVLVTLALWIIILSRELRKMEIRATTAECDARMLKAENDALLQRCSRARLG